jgi:AbrB family looped-hinge helix DNA binding protein
MTTTLTISKGGQISIPAEIRRRWATGTVSLEDRGDQLVLRPVPEDPIRAAMGSVALADGVTTEQLRERARREPGR